MQKAVKILFCGGGSGGHIYPLLSIESQLAKKYKVTSLYIGYNKPIDASIFSLEEKRFILLPNIFLSLNPLLPIFILQAVLICVKIFLSFKPTLIISSGSRSSIMPVIIGKIIGIPITVLELNYTFGKVTRFITLFASKVMTCWNKTPSGTLMTGKKLVVNPPVRGNLVNSCKSRPYTATIHDITTKKRNKKTATILIVGGSQGAMILNRSVPKVISDVARHIPLKVTHISGQNNFTTVNQTYNSLKHPQLSIDVIEYSNNLMSLIKNSELIISRAGANIIIECAFYNKPAILIPITHSSLQHQFYNARTLQNACCARMVMENNLTTGQLRAILLRYIKEIDEREKMGKLLHNFFFSDDRHKISDAITI